MNEDGTMARMPQLQKIAKTFDLKLISIEDLVSYRMKHDSLIELQEDFDIETAYGNFRLRAYHQKTNNQIHIALTLGTWEKDEVVLTRVHTHQLNNELAGILNQKKESALDKIFKEIRKEGKGAIIFINQLQPANKLLDQIKALKSTTHNAPKFDEKDFGIGAQMIHAVGISNIKLLSNSNKIKRVGMSGYGLKIVSYENY
jgi:3,4-dihydroxy 2-butanone 4-phosphate synthase/GTP cyclohydrolase II